MNRHTHILWRWSITLAMSCGTVPAFAFEHAGAVDPLADFTATQLDEDGNPVSPEPGASTSSIDKEEDPAKKKEIEELTKLFAAVLQQKDTPDISKLTDDQQKLFKALLKPTKEFSAAAISTKELSNEDLKALSEKLAKTSDDARESFGQLRANVAALQLQRTWDIGSELFQKLVGREKKEPEKNEEKTAEKKADREQNKEKKSKTDGEKKTASKEPSFFERILGSSDSSHSRSAETEPQKSAKPETKPGSSIGDLIDRIGSTDLSALKNAITVKPSVDAALQNSKLSDDEKAKIALAISKRDFNPAAFDGLQSPEIDAVLKKIQEARAKDKNDVALQQAEEVLKDAQWERFVADNDLYEYVDPYVRPADAKPQAPTASTPPSSEQLTNLYDGLKIGYDAVKAGLAPIVKPIESIVDAAQTLFSPPSPVTAGPSVAGPAGASGSPGSAGAPGAPGSSPAASPAAAAPAVVADSAAAAPGIVPVVPPENANARSATVDGHAGNLAAGLGNTQPQPGMAAEPPLSLPVFNAGPYEQKPLLLPTANRPIVGLGKTFLAPTTTPTGDAEIPSDDGLISFNDDAKKKLERKPAKEISGSKDAGTTAVALAPVVAVAPPPAPVQAAAAPVQPATTTQYVYLPSPQPAAASSSALSSPSASASTKAAPPETSVKATQLLGVDDSGKTIQPGGQTLGVSVASTVASGGSSSAPFPNAPSPGSTGPAASTSTSYGPNPAGSGAFSPSVSAQVRAASENNGQSIPAINAGAGVATDPWVVAGTKVADGSGTLVSGLQDVPIKLALDEKAEDPAKEPKMTAARAARVTAPPKSVGAQVAAALPPKSRQAGYNRPVERRLSSVRAGT